MFNKIKALFKKEEPSILTKEQTRRLNSEEVQFRLIQMLCLDTSFIISGDYDKMTPRWNCSIAGTKGVISGGWHNRLSKAIVSLLNKHWDNLTIKQRKRIIRLLNEEKYE